MEPAILICLKEIIFYILWLLQFLYWQIYENFA